MFSCRRVVSKQIRVHTHTNKNEKRIKKDGGLFPHVRSISIFCSFFFTFLPRQKPKSPVASWSAAFSFFIIQVQQELKAKQERKKGALCSITIKRGRKKGHNGNESYKERNEKIPFWLLSFLFLLLFLLNFLDQKLSNEERSKKGRKLMPSLPFTKEERRMEEKKAASQFLGLPPPSKRIIIIILRRNEKRGEEKRMNERGEKKLFCSCLAAATSHLLLKGIERDFFMITTEEGRSEKGK